MRRMAFWFTSMAVAVAVGTASPARAQSGAPGLQAIPPRAPGDPGLSPQLDQRKAVRGCPVDQACGGAKETMLSFELAAFPQPGKSPWLDDAKPPPRAQRTGARAADLRPDMAWLDGLVMPDLPVVWSDKLIDYLDFYKHDKRGQNTIRGWLRASGRYRDMIVRELRRAQLPEDLLYISMIESSFDPGESSYAGAAGLWQFMPAGGKIYGLRVDRWVDERNDPYRATLAVLGYWADLKQRFGDWHLAMAAYNAGYGAVLRSMARYNSNDYWALCAIENGLAWETTNYVPKALAVAIIGRNRAAFGMAEVELQPAETWETVTVAGSTSIGALAKASGASADAVKRLNPHLRRGRTPPDERDYLVRVPVGSKATYARRIADLGSGWDGMDAYVMRYGERFEDIATTFGVSTRKLRELNEIGHETDVGGGTLLVVPKISAEARAKNAAKADLALHASGVDQQPDEPLLVAVPDKERELEGRQRVYYRVVAGDDLEAIAGALAVRPKDLREWNGFVDANVHPRQVLQAYLAPDADTRHVQLLDPTRLAVVTRGSAEHLDLLEARVGRTRVDYTAKKSESFEAIAKKFGLGPRDLARINRRPSTTVLQPGERIVVYKVVDRTRSERAAEQWKKTPKANRGGKPEPQATPVVPMHERAEAGNPSKPTVAPAAKVPPATPAPAPKPPSAPIDDAVGPASRPDDDVADDKANDEGAAAPADLVTDPT